MSRDDFALWESNDRCWWGFVSVVESDLLDDASHAA